MLVTQQLMVANNFKKNTMEVNGCLVTNILYNIFFWVQQNFFINAGLEQLLSKWQNSPF